MSGLNQARQIPEASPEAKPVASLDAGLDASLDAGGRMELQAAVPAWKQELHARLAAHRGRRPAVGFASAHEPVAEQTGSGGSRAALVASRVAERYAQAPSYSEMLAASAAAAAAAAETAAFAARESQEAAEALARLASSSGEDPRRQDGWERAGREPGGDSGEGSFGSSFESTDAVGHRSVGTFARGSEPAGAGNTVEYPEPLPARGVVPPRPAGPEPRLAGGGIVDAFAEAMVAPAVSLPAKLIEFPRELIAPRKVRPRIAEGPLREESLLVEEEEAASLRIFEVDGAGEATAWQLASTGLDESRRLFDPVDREAAQQRSASPGGQQRMVYGEPGRDEPEAPGDRGPMPGQAQPARRAGKGSRLAPAASQASGWQTIRLGEHPVSGELPEAEGALPVVAPNAQAGVQAGGPLLVHPATLGDRTMAALVDLSVVAGGFLLFVLVFAACTAHPPVTKGALAAGAAVFAGLLVFYQWLFLSYGLATPGMRYARIALCTFEDENPTRKVRERRVWASALAALPMGLGLLWALFDEETLGWHDRMSRSYQRSYR